MARPQGHPLNRDAWFDWIEQKLGKNLTTIAHEAEMNRATLSGLVAGHQLASVELAHRVATTVGCRVGTLFPSLGSDAARLAERAA